MKIINLQPSKISPKNIPMINWVLAGFSFSYILFFIRSIFLSVSKMQFFRYIEALDLIGGDLIQTLRYSESWFILKQAPFYGYSPLASVLFTPLLFLQYFWAYKIISLFTLSSFVVLTYILPKRINRETQISPLLVLILITGLISYGVQFEIERGQFNLIAMLFCFLQFISFITKINTASSRISYLSSLYN